MHLKQLDLRVRRRSARCPSSRSPTGLFSPLAQIAGGWIEIGEADFGGFRSMAATLTLAMTLTVAVAERRQQKA